MSTSSPLEAEGLEVAIQNHAFVPIRLRLSEGLSPARVILLLGQHPIAVMTELMEEDVQKLIGPSRRPGELAANPAPAFQLALDLQPVK